MPTFVDKTEVDAGASVSSVDVAIPAGAQAGDVMIAFVTRSANDSGADWDDDGGGGNGWTRLDYNRDTGGRDRESAIYYKVHDGSESTPTFTHGTNAPTTGSMTVWRDVDDAIFDVTYVTATHHNQGTNTTTPTNQPITTNTDNAMVLVFHQATHDDITASGAPSGYDMRSEVNAQPADHRNQFVASKEVTSAGTETPGAWTHNSHSTPEYHCYTIALKAATDREVDINEAVAVEDFPGIPGELIVVTEDITVEVETPTGDGDISVTDTITVTDVVTMQLPESFIDVNEAITVTEDVTVSRDGPPDLSISVNEAITVTDVPTIAVQGVALEIDISEEAGSPTDTAYLLPQGDGLVNQNDPLSAGDSYVEVDEASADDDTSYIKSPSGGFGARTDRFTFDFSEIGDNDTINSITVFVRAKRVGGDTNDGVAPLMFGNSLTQVGTKVVPGTSAYEDVEETFSPGSGDIMPNDGADLKDDWEFGFRFLSNNLGADDIRATQVKVKVNYSPATSAEPVTVTESVTVAVVTPPASDADIDVFDAVTVAEDVNMLLESNINVNEAITVAEDITLFLPTLVLNVFEAITVTENVATSLDSFLSVNDAITVAESVTAELASTINVFDEVSVAEAVTMEVVSSINVNEAITVAENITVLIPFFALSVFDAVAVAEDVTATLISFVNVNEAVTVTEDVTVEAVLTINVNETVTVAENVTVFLPFHAIDKFEAVTVSESVTIKIDGTISEFEAVTVNEQVQLSVDSFVSVNDAITVSEDVTVEVPILINVFEGITVAESITTGGVHFTLSVFDAVTVSEQVTASVVSFVNVNDTVTIAESVTVEAELNVDVFEAITVAEDTNVEATGDFEISVSEAITVTDVPTMQVPEEFISVSEEITVEESIDVLHNNERNINTFEAISVAEWVRLLVSAGPIDTYMVYGENGAYLEVVVDGVEVARFKDDGSLDVNGNINENAF